MDYQGQILAFLEKPENLPIALEVAKHVEALRPRLHKTFWTAMDQALIAKLQGSKFENRWMIYSNPRSFDQADKNLRIHIKFIPDAFKGPHLTVCLQQGLSIDHYGLIYGLAWGRQERSVPDNGTFRHLVELSKPFGFPEKNQNRWWPIFRNLNIAPRSDEFMLQYGLDPAGFIEEITLKIWTYFIKIEPHLYQLNQDLFEEKY